jgi:VanZ family protein
MPGNFAPMQALNRLNLSDKLEHFSAYFVLAVIPALTERTPVRIVIAIGLIALGVTLEFLQIFTGRDFEVNDMIANTCGVALGMLVGFGWLALRRRNNGE